MIPFSVLDLSPITRGSNAGQSLHNSLDLARHTESLGYLRYWLAEHHSMPGIASAATAVVIGHVAAGTSRIRVGAGGHHVAQSLTPGGCRTVRHVGSSVPRTYRPRTGPGAGIRSDDGTRAQTQPRDRIPDQFPHDVLELQRYLAPATADQQVVAVPGVGSNVPLWILGSSLFGAQVAAALACPSHSPPTSHPP